jgi:hypothetical protein
VNHGQDGLSPDTESLNFELIVYYTGFVLAIALCRNLGPIFYVPMLFDMGFDIALNLGLLSGWDIRLVMVTYGFAVLLWVLALSGAFSKTTFVTLLLLDLTLIFTKILPSLQAAGTGQEFWNQTSTGIFNIWSLSIFVVVLSIVFRSTVWARLHGKFVDLLTNPRKRFLIPLGLWSGIITLGGQLESFLPEWFVERRFQISALALVWGWVAFELPFFLMHRRVKRRFEDLG